MATNNPVKEEVIINPTSTEDGFSLFGFRIVRKSKEKEQEAKSPVIPTDNEGDDRVSHSGPLSFGHSYNFDVTSSADEQQLIRRYREAALYPECDAAIEDIINEAIVGDSKFGAAVSVNVDAIDTDTGGEKMKNIIQEEFQKMLELMDFNSFGYDIFRRWYIDGRLYFHIIIDTSDPKQGIIELRPIDALNITKKREVIEETDPDSGISYVAELREYFEYCDITSDNTRQEVLAFDPDSIAYVTSGITSADRQQVHSYLHKALKPVHQLRIMEDSLVIYRVSRAPERRVFYVDVGNLPTGKAEAYMRQLMQRHENQLVLDMETGQLTDDKRHMSMLEDFWMPRREGGRGTEIDTLQGADHLDEISDIEYFQKKLYKSLNVPINRLEQEMEFSLGRSSEITRDELKFHKFINRIRKRFSVLFFDLLRKQLLLKEYCSEDEWEMIGERINIEFERDVFFAELKEMELLNERLSSLSDIEDYIGEYFSKRWIKRHVLHMTDEEIESMEEEIAQEKADNPDDGDDW